MSTTIKNTDKQTIDDLEEIVKENVYIGVEHALFTFARENKSLYEPTQVCEKPLEAFAQLLLCQPDEKPDEYPFPFTFNEMITAHMQGSALPILSLADKGEINEVRKLSRAMGNEFTRNFLKLYFKNIVSAMDKIRGV